MAKKQAATAPSEPPRYAIGIDLGTTNCVLAYRDLAADDGNEAAAIRILDVPQVVAIGTVEALPALPSFVYLPTAEQAGRFALPWGEAEVVVGRFARDQSSEQPERTIAAAKSWLSHSAVDRTAELLPWQSACERKLSPVAAYAATLEHLVAAWNHASPETPLSGQRVVVTVPASFDAAAQELVRNACERAGLPPSFTLLEEPQAALYAWLADQGDAWRKRLEVGDRVFVCDVGGGTTDFTLIDVAEGSGQLELTRKAVGRHLLVGGDNMDLALAHHAAGEFERAGVALDPWQSVSLWHACRRAKETLLALDGPATTPIAVAKRGRGLVAGTASIDLASDAAADLLTDGFFPDVPLDAAPESSRASGFLEMGLPFEQDTAITRHIAAFLREHAADAPPTRVLFNGGVFAADRFREQVFSSLADWFPDTVCENLDAAADLHGAVARGAAFYAAASVGRGVRIRGGAPRSYYVGIETAGLAVPGAPRPLHAVCVLPRGMEEGTETAVPVDGVGVVVGQPVRFRFFSSPVRTDTPGERLPRWPQGELIETDPVAATLDPGENAPGSFVPVRFESRLTELGEFELWCVAAQDADGDGEPQRWRMAFTVRE